MSPEIEGGAGVRKLAYCAGGFSAAIFLAHFLLPARWVLPGALAAVVLALVTLLLPGQTRRRVMAALLSAAIGFGWYAAASALRLTPVQNVSGDVQTVTARVTEYPVAYARSYGLTALLTSPDVPNCKARLYVSDADAAALRPGDEITADVKFRPSTLRYGEETDAYISKGIYLIGSVRDKTLARTGVWSRSWLYWPKTVAQSIKTSAQAAFPADVLPFAQALMLGDKSALYAQDLDIPLSTTGIMHTVAVSGLHLAFLLGFLRLFTGNRRMTAIIGLPMMVVFVVMAGCSPSVLRAAFMTALVLFAPLLGRENDPPTSLLTALAILLAANPFAAASISLQLSFASMAGLFCVSGALYRIGHIARGQSVCRGEHQPAALVCVHGGPVLCLWCAVPRARCAPAAHRCEALASAAEDPRLFQCHNGELRRRHGVYRAAHGAAFRQHFAHRAGYEPAHPVAAAGRVHRLLPRGAARPCLGMGRHGARVGDGVAAAVYPRCGKRALKTSGCSAVHGSRMVVWWLVLVYAMFGAAWLLSRRRKVRYWIPAACSVLALCAVLTVNAVQLQRTSTVTALDVSQGQSIVFSSGRSCAVVDCGGRSTAEDPGDLAARKLLAQGHRSLDLLVLTHPHDDHVNGVLRLMHWLPVRTLVIPAAADITQAPLSDILALAEANHTTVVRVDAQQTIAAGGISVRLYPEPCAGQEDGSMIVLASIGDYDTLVPGDVDTTAEVKFLSSCTYPDIELLLVGHHGSKRSTGDAWLDAIAPDAAIISVGYNSYGHPTSDTLERLQAHHIPIYRTDQMGDITVHLS